MNRISWSGWVRRFGQPTLTNLCASLCALAWVGCVGSSGPDTCGTPPEAERCRQLCTDVCDRLGSCGVTWQPSCEVRCSQAFACPGETVDHDGVICAGLSSEIKTLTCDQLCHWSKASPHVQPWGSQCLDEWEGDCEAMLEAVGDECPNGFGQCFTAGGPCASSNCIPIPGIGDVDVGSRGYSCDQGKVSPFIALD